MMMHLLVETGSQGETQGRKATNLFCLGILLKQSANYKELKIKSRQRCFSNQRFDNKTFAFLMLGQWTNILDSTS